MAWCLVKEAQGQLYLYLYKAKKKKKKKKLVRFFLTLDEYSDTSVSA
jgi:exonuclease I